MNVTRLVAGCRQIYSDSCRARSTIAHELLQMSFKATSLDQCTFFSGILSLCVRKMALASCQKVLRKLLTFSMMNRWDQAPWSSSTERQKIFCWQLCVHETYFRSYITEFSLVHWQEIRTFYLQLYFLYVFHRTGLFAYLEITYCNSLVRMFFFFLVFYQQYPLSRSVS